ncbi:GTPase [Arcanobacterium ihumii]|uniref:GTPase n=1 Tax=Arcanobacterium ihumii TaxID=2138162 RepID=UPI000F5213A8|nr:GTPase [Arcanobacterium ihumii]
MSISFAEGITNLEQILELSQGRIEAKKTDDIEAFLDYSAKRREHGVEHAVVAFAGGTGAGKSSLFNAVTGIELARVAPTRPTTSEAQAICTKPVPELLDWLDVRIRHVDPAFSKTLGLPTGKGSASVIMLDLPDIDSTNDHNRMIAGKLAEKVDVLVWVLDPQKYADSIVHDDYLSSMRHHAEVTVVVLNQIDMLKPAEAQAVVADAERHIRAHGINVEVVPTSAVQGTGIVQLRSKIGTVVRRKNNAYLHMCAQIRDISESLLEENKGPDSGIETKKITVQGSTLVNPLGKALGIDRVADILFDSCVYRGQKKTGWFFTRWILKNKVDPLKRFRLDLGTSSRTKNDGGESDDPLLKIPIIEINPAHHAQFDNSVGEFVRNSLEDLPRNWRNEVIADLKAKGEDLSSKLALIVKNSNFADQRNPGWWIMASFVQWLCGLLTIAGLAWIGLLVFGPLIQIQLADPPKVDIAGIVKIGVPLLVLLGGILGGGLAALISRILVRRRARRIKRRFIKNTQNALRVELDKELFAPLFASIEEFNEFLILARSLAKVGK